VGAREEGENSLFAISLSTLPPSPWHPSGNVRHGLEALFDLEEKPRSTLSSPLLFEGEKH